MPIERPGMRKFILNCFPDSYRFVQNRYFYTSLTQQIHERGTLAIRPKNWVFTLKIAKIFGKYFGNF